jgi:hypothetical protein|eukprot:2297872-Prymnesium_polylepis.2
MVPFTLVNIGQKQIVAWSSQLFDKGNVFIAEDIRGTYQIFSRTMRGLQEGIENTTFQRVSSSSLYEAKLGQLKKGRTATFTVRCLPRDQTIEYLNSSNGFEKKIASLYNPVSIRFVTN